MTELIRRICGVGVVVVALSLVVNAQTVFSIAALEQEIINDTLGLGYKNSAAMCDWKTDAQIRIILTNDDGANPRTVTHTRVSTADIRASLEFEAFDGLVTSEQAWFEWLTANGEILINAYLLQQLAGIPTANGSIWAAADRNTANAAMAALMQFQGSRAEELWGEGTRVSDSQVGQAFNLQCQ